MLKMTQKLFRKNNSGELILSPYVVIKPLNKVQLRLEREDIKKYIILEASNHDTLIYLVDNLKRGIYKENLTKLLFTLGVENPDVWINLCLKEGVLE